MEGQKIHWGDLHQKFRKTKPVIEEGCGVVHRYEHGHPRTFSDSQGRPRTLTNTHAHSPQSTGHDSQSPAHNSQLTIQSPRSALRCSQLTTNSQLTAHSPQFTAHSPQPAAYSSQFTSHHSQLAVHNSHPAAHRPRPTNYSSQLTMNNPHSSHGTSAFTMQAVAAPTKLKSKRESARRRSHKRRIYNASSKASRHGTGFGFQCCTLSASICCVPRGGLQFTV